MEFIKSTKLNPINSFIFSKPDPSYNETLAGLFFIPKEGENPKIPCTLHCPQSNACPYIMIFCHAISTDLGRIRESMEELTNQLGIYVITFDYSGHGIAVEENNATSEASLSRDGMIVLNYVQTQLSWPAERIILYGHGMGSGVAAHCALQAQQKGSMIMGLFLQSAFTCVKDIATHLYGFFGNIVVNRFNNREVLQQLRCPLLLSHGKRDAMVPYKMSVLLMEEYSGNETKLFHPAIESSHFDMSLKNDVAAPVSKFISMIEAVRQRDNIIIPNIPKHDYNAWLASLDEFKA